MLENIEHIGIAVKNAEESMKLFNALLNTKPYKEEAVISENVRTIFYKTGETKIELLESSNDESAIAKFIEKKGEGIHHIAFAVKDIYAEIERLKTEGFVFVNETPKKGADNKLIVFLHPKSSNGVLIELCQEII
ncbi:MAG: methylmalonyl-CoA epimerase [Bacteroidia bacterium]